MFPRGIVRYASVFRYGRRICSIKSMESGLVGIARTVTRDGTCVHRFSILRIAWEFNIFNHLSKTVNYKEQG
jgi:hypothetical protein